jgi:hypothetical protein
MRCLSSSLNVQITLPITSKAQALVYLPAGLTFTNYTFSPHSVLLCFVWVSEQTAFFLYSFSRQNFKAETDSVFVRYQPNF